MNQPTRLSLPAIWNMSFGFLGIQFGWGLQMANMSPIYKYLGAADDQIAKLWLAAPLTGFIVQPIIGAMSDRTWCWLGRRRPYFLVGAILSSLALVLMPNAGTLAAWLVPQLPKFYMAAGFLWILDASINISMEPFRAFVADKLPEEQRGSGFAMQSLFIGLGAFVAGFMPTILRNGFLRFAPRLIVDVRDHDAGAVSRIIERDLPPNAVPCAGYECSLSGKQPLSHGSFLTP